LSLFSNQEGDPGKNVSADWNFPEYWNLTCRNLAPALWGLLTAVTVWAIRTYTRSRNLGAVVLTDGMQSYFQVRLAVVSARGRE